MVFLENTQARVHLSLCLDEPHFFKALGYTKSHFGFLCAITRNSNYFLCMAYAHGPELCLQLALGVSFVWYIRSLDFLMSLVQLHLGIGIISLGQERFPPYML